MSRYFTKPIRARWYVEDFLYEDPIRADTPEVCDHEATDTGLLDLNGDPIMRAPNPVGFGRDEEW